MTLFPEETIRYKTFAKQTLVDGLAKVFQGHPDDLLQRTKVSIEYPKTEQNFPCVVVRLFEREIRNAGVGHEEIVQITGDSATTDVAITLEGLAAVQLSWPAVADAVRYHIYRTANKQTVRYATTEPGFTDTGEGGAFESPPTIVTATLATPEVTAIAVPGAGLLPQGSYVYNVVAIGPSQAVRFEHYYYTADIEFNIGALTAFDRDLVADTLVQTIAFGTLQDYTSNFLDRIYPSTEIYPDAQLHFININADQIQGFGENQEQTPWGAEDDLVYNTSYRTSVFGELYSLPPKVTYGVVRKVFLYPYVGSLEATPDPPGANPFGWVSNSV